ncbi:BTB/POZ protein [Tribonema minus]|uniref:BTB/POZ protein n=1 Tax=Tribonema minus TaxID=303371 RepID=A0A835ZEM1_9STRA|nr:BTB/POZ protein [Tribonema minus]
MPRLSAVVELNVGGTPFTTSRSTLTAEPNSMLARMVQGDMPSAEDSQGRIFIDRNGSLFHVVLEYLREYGGDHFALPTLTADSLARLRREVEFYGLEGLLLVLDNAEQPSKPADAGQARFEYAWVMEALPRARPIHEGYWSNQGEKDRRLQETVDHQGLVQLPKLTLLVQQGWQLVETHYAHNVVKIRDGRGRVHCDSYSEAHMLVKRLIVESDV